MLASSYSRTAAKITVTVNGRALEAKKGDTIMTLCDRNGIRIPRLCYQPCLPLQGTCGLCVVQVNNHGVETLSNACVTKCVNGLKVNTLAQKVVDQVHTNLQKLLDVHDERCSNCVANNRCEFRNLVYDFDVTNLTHHAPIPDSIDDSTHSIRIDPSKCVDCGRCVRACKQIAGQKVLKIAPLADREAAVQTVNGQPLDETNCIKCGQCTLYCPVGAITENSQIHEVIDSIRNHQKKLYVCEVSPSVHIALGEAFGYPPGKLTEAHVVSALRMLGFDMVFDTKFGGDLLIMEEAAQLVERIKNKKNSAPFFSSACPAFVNYIEQSRSPFIPNLSTSRSAPAMIASIVREDLPTKLNLKPEDIYNVSITTCTAKKDDIQRPQFSTKTGVKDTDVSLTVRELAEMIKLAGINLHGLTEESKYDQLYGGEGSGAGSLIDVAGGFLEATLRTAHWMLTGKSPTKLEFKELRGDKATKVSEVTIGDQKIKVAAVQGMANAMKLFDKIKKDKDLKDIKYVEIMACTGGCVCGGGTSIISDKEAMAARTKQVYADEAKAAIRCAHENPAIGEIYQTYLEKPNSHKAHDLLHTHFSHRPGF